MHTIVKQSKSTTITRPRPTAPAITAQERDWQREVYEIDPTGGSASRY